MDYSIVMRVTLCPVWRLPWDTVCRRCFEQTWSPQSFYLQAKLCSLFGWFPFILVSCDHDRSCGKGFSCDRHFLVCVPLKQAGQYCRRDAQCLKGLTCMFGKCHHSIPEGQEGARCKLDKDCGGSMCCARHHGEMICKRRLMLGESCFVPDGGLAFSINQICPCEEGLLCRKATDVPQREKEFVYRPEVENWQCQAPAV
ncbi:dickkopf-related protein 3-like isoform X2 [Polypterus senegalus]|uniref:dickkopf-related protein 3-like isoform X2 n=1 Tax=Polypterus senegalus TaxID=55291 RepID=UPI001966A56F|nr:dickkopf-related protein 3-like isoform X2 [Polypterus senegalus]XP_039596241.1 dickkopf-related protein 3-like isoform X2 [Polypterus senegalus]XP_039596242.1 dickkopf-related protein 3-like isoform X2 [Polypterus senegalus]